MRQTDRDREEGMGGEEGREEEGRVSDRDALARMAWFDGFS